MKIIGWVGALPAAAEMIRELLVPEDEWSLVLVDVRQEGRWRFWQELRRFLRCLSAWEQRFFFRLYLRGNLHWTDDIRAERTSDWLRHQRPDVGIHGVNVIYPAEVLRVHALGILNVHPAPLPGFRGRSAVEWSLLTGPGPVLSLIRLDEGIDTGEILASVRPSLPAQNTAAALRDALLACRFPLLRQGLAAYRTGKPPIQLQRAEDGRRYFPISDLFRAAADRLASSGPADDSAVS